MVVNKDITDFLKVYDIDKLKDLQDFLSVQMYNYVDISRYIVKKFDMCIDVIEDYKFILFCLDVWGFKYEKKDR